MEGVGKFLKRKLPHRLYLPDVDTQINLENPQLLFQKPKASTGAARLHRRNHLAPKHPLRQGGLACCQSLVEFIIVDQGKELFTIDERIVGINNLTLS